MGVVMEGVDTEVSITATLSSYHTMVILAVEEQDGIHTGDIN